jgi:hypothetical protein
MGLRCHGCRLTCLRHRLDGLWSHWKGELEKLVELMGQEPRLKLGLKMENMVNTV